MNVALIGSVLCAAVAGFLLPRGGGLAGRRLGALSMGRGEERTPARVPAGSGGRTGRDAVRRRAVAAMAGLVSALLVGGLGGLVVGGLVAVGCDRVLARLEPAEVRRRRARVAADLPIAVELLGACLRGGTSWGEAVDAVASAVGGPLGGRLGEIGALIRLGADPAAAWLTLTDDPVLLPLARTVARTVDSGASLAPALVRLARDQRRVAQAAAMTRARSAGIKAVAPLGLCFLPAFVLLGIVPAIAGIAATLQLP